MSNVKQLKQPHHDQVVVVIVPFPSHSHLNQLLNLAHHLSSSYNLPIHYAATTTTAATTAATTTTIHFHNLNIPSPANPNNTTTSSTATTTTNFHLPDPVALRHRVNHLLHQLSPNFRRLILIHDTFMSFAVEQSVKTLPNIESYTFHSFSPFSLFFHFWESIPNNQKPFDLQHDIDHMFKNLPTCAWCPFPHFRDYVAKQYKLCEEFESGRVYNSSRIIDGEYVSLLERLSSSSVKHFAIGPFHSLDIKNMDTDTITLDKCLEWLDKKGKDSVIYVSFGTTVSMSLEQIKELSIGLEKSGVHYLWVVRGSDFDDNTTSFYRGNSKRMVVEWAPQLEILGRPATGGFMTHCGWGSCIETISMGVPILGWPMHSDQPKNSELLTRVLKMGIQVRKWVDRVEVVDSGSVEKVVRRLMVSEEGDEMRRRARELRFALRESLSCGPGEMDSFVGHITRNDN